MIIVIILIDIKLILGNKSVGNRSKDRPYEEERKIIMIQIMKDIILK